MATKYKKQANGYYRTRAWDGTYNEDGTKHYKSICSRKSSADLERKVRAFKAEVEERNYVQPTDMSFSAFALWWYQNYKATTAEKTKEMYRWVINTHIKDASMRVNEFTSVDMFLKLHSLQGKPNAQQKYLLTIRQVIRAAVSLHYYPAAAASDLLADMPSIRYKPAEKRPLTQNEKDAVFKADFKPMDKVFVFLLYGCGLRREEALALSKTDFDLAAHTVRINKAVTFVDGRPVEKEPKSVNSKRVLPIPDFVYTVVAPYVTDLPDGARLFTLRSGGLFTKTGYDRMWERILKAMQAVAKEPITGLTAHIFRHNYTTALCSQIPELSIPHIAKLLGDTEALVMRVYSHINLEKEDALRSVNKALNPS